MEKYSEKFICTIYLVRHGQTEWNEKQITQGQSESNISRIGIDQAKTAGELFKNIEFSAIYSSDLSMAYKTAGIIKLNRNLPVRKSKLLRGRSYGSFEGKHIDIYQNKFKARLTDIEILPEREYWSLKIAPDVETDEELATRVIKKIKSISVAHSNSNVLIVTHGGCIKCLLMKLGYMKRKLFSQGPLKHGGYIKLLTDGEKISVEEVGEDK